jgi:cathepsin B
MPELLNIDDVKGSCERLEMCETESFLEILLEERPMNLETHVNIVNNNPKSTWVAGMNDKFNNMSRKQAENMMGTVVDSQWTFKDFEILGDEPLRDLPGDFDSRANWPKCEGTINHIRDQSNCGSCWAHGTTEAFNDRMCIATDGAFDKLLSVSDTTACCNATKCYSFGCNGGQVGSPWGWFEKFGVVTGGDFDDGKYCYDYTMAKCNHHQPKSSFPECEDIKQVEPTCGTSCPSNTKITYGDDKTKAKSSYGIRGVDQIKSDIYTNGPATGAFTVYEDFLTYKSGVYSHQSGDSLGGHAIKVIGWGEDDGVEYWLCVNSWNDTWGDQGTFKIMMGDCGIDGQIHAGEVGPQAAFFLQ